MTQTFYVHAKPHTESISEEGLKMQDEQTVSSQGVSLTSSHSHNF